MNHANEPSRKKLKIFKRYLVERYLIIVSISCVWISPGVLHTLLGCLHRLCYLGLSNELHTTKTPTRLGKGPRKYNTSGRKVSLSELNSRLVVTDLTRELETNHSGTAPQQASPLIPYVCFSPETAKAALAFSL